MRRKASTYHSLVLVGLFGWNCVIVDDGLAEERPSAAATAPASTSRGSPAGVPAEAPPSLPPTAAERLFDRPDVRSLSFGVVGVGEPQAGKQIAAAPGLLAPTASSSSAPADPAAPTGQQRRVFAFKDPGRSTEFRIDPDGSFAQRDITGNDIRRLEQGWEDGKRREILLRERDSQRMATVTRGNGESYKVITGDRGWGPAGQPGSFPANSRLTVYTDGRPRQVEKLDPGAGEAQLERLRGTIDGERFAAGAGDGAGNSTPGTCKFGNMARDGWSTELQVDAGGSWRTRDTTQGGAFRQMVEGTNGKIDQFYIRQGADKQRLLNVTDSDGSYTITAGSAGWGRKGESGSIAPNSSFKVAADGKRTPQTVPADKLIDSYDQRLRR